LAEARGGVDPRLAPPGGVEIGASAPPPPSRRRLTGPARSGLVDRTGPTGPSSDDQTGPTGPGRLHLPDRPDRENMGRWPECRGIEAGTAQKD
jgi:hypothetical protein